MNKQKKHNRAEILSNYVTEGYNRSDIKINAQGQPYVQHTEGQIMLSLKAGRTYDSFHNGQQRQTKRIF